MRESHLGTKGSIARQWAWIGSLLLVMSVAAATPAAAVEWKEFTKANTVTITTNNADGTPKQTTVWLIVLEGFPYVRTGNTSWAENIARDPNVLLNVDKQDFLLRAVQVQDQLLIERLQAAYREKYGLSDRLVGLMPGAGTKLFRLDARP
jgi:hypothetical protein